MYDQPLTIDQALTTEGIFTRCTLRGCVPYRWSRGTLCVVAVSVDGIPFWEQDYATITMDDVQGMEVYRSAYGGPVSSSQMAVVFPSREQFATAATCGSVMIWTR